MKLWLCSYPNGDRAIVHASDREDVLFRLDELCVSAPETIKEYRGNFFAFFYPAADVGDGAGEPGWLLDSDNVSEDTWEVLGDAGAALVQRNEADR